MKIILKLYCSSSFPIFTESIKLFLPLDHDDVVAELGLDWRIRIGRVPQARHRQGEGCVLEWSHHRSTGLQKIGINVFHRIRPDLYQYMDPFFGFG